MLERIIYDKKNFVDEIINKAGYSAIKKLFLVLKRDPKLLINDVIHHYFIKEFGQSPLKNHIPINIPNAMVPKMKPDEFVIYISNLLKGLVS